ncbi:hypothetical protein VPH35_002003 [Triticum aestivum]
METLCCWNNEINPQLDPNLLLIPDARARYNATWEIVTHLRFVPPQDPVRLLSSAFLYAQLCVLPRQLPLLLLGTGKNPAIVCSWLQFNFMHKYCFDSQICAWLQRHSMKSHNIYTSSSEMFHEVLLRLSVTMVVCQYGVLGSCVP